MRRPRGEDQRRQQRQAEGEVANVDVIRHQAASRCGDGRIRRMQRGDERDLVALLLDRLNEVGQREAAYELGQQRDRPGEQRGGEPPDEQRAGEPREDQKDESRERVRTASSQAATAGRSASGRGNVRTQSSQTTSTSSMISACQT